MTWNRRCADWNCRVGSLQHRVSRAIGRSRFSRDRQLQGAEALSEYVRRVAYTVHHPVGSCRMGQDPNAVVDAQLRVHGIAGLRVADASVFPRVVGGNTNAAVVMVAEKAADMMLGIAAPPPLELTH